MWILSTSGIGGNPTTLVSAFHASSMRVRVQAQHFSKSTKTMRSIFVNSCGFFDAGQFGCRG